jgi:transposase
MRKEPVVEKSITWIGLDAHKEFIAVAMRASDSKDFIETKLPNESDAIRRFVKKVVRKAPGEVRMAYEAGCCGYALQRQLETAGPVVCEIIAPALIPRKPGERVKTDRRDARKLCELLEAGLLTTVQPVVAKYSFRPKIAGPEVSSGSRSVPHTRLRFAADK